MYSGTSGLNLKTLLENQGAVDRAVAIEEQFTALEAILNKVPLPLSEHIYEPEVREQLLLLIQGIEILHESLGKSMGMLELQLGFNSRDGD
jgi:predicted lipoprotein